MVVPELTSVVRVTRGGDLREQTVDGKLDVYWATSKIGQATASVAGRVADGQLTAAVDAQV